MAKAFTSVKLPKVPRSKFNLSYRNNFACYMGQLWPCLVEEVLPNDKFFIGNQVVLRTQPLKAPVMEKITYDIRYFFVPNRIVDEDFEKAINGFNMSINATNSVNNTFADNSNLIKHYDPANINQVTPGSGQSQNERWQFSLWSAFGFPKTASGSMPSKSTLMSQGMCPVAYLWYAYNAIYNYYYRDENIIDEVSEDSDVIQWSCYSKNDYFLSSLPFPQKGIAPTLSFTFGANAMAPVGFGVAHQMASGTYQARGMNSGINYPVNGGNGARDLLFNGNMVADDPQDFLGSGTDFHKLNMSVTNTDTTAYAQRGLWSDLSGVQSGSFDADELRELFAIQEFLEVNAVGGTRFAEFILAHFGTYTGDYRIGKPQYLGGSKSEIAFSEIPNLANTTANIKPLGYLGGKGVGASSYSIKPFTAHEHGYIIGIFRILPNVSWKPQGFNKKFLKNSFTDYYFPSFAHLGEQVVKYGELYYDFNNVRNPNDVFGFQGIYNEYRHNRDVTTGYMSGDYDYWNLSQTMSNNMHLNKPFLQCQGNDSDVMRIFSVTNEPPFIVSIGNIVSAVRAIPTYPTPSRLVV